MNFVFDLRPKSPHQKMQDLDNKGEAYWIEDLVTRSHDFLPNLRLDVLTHSDNWLQVRDQTERTYFINMHHVVSLNIVEG